MHRHLPEKILVSDRDIFDISIVTTNGKIFVIWSEYYPERDGKVSVYSCCCSDGKCQEPTLIYASHDICPYIKLTVGMDSRIHLLFARLYGSSTEFLLKTYDGSSWNPEIKLLEIGYDVFSYDIIESKMSGKMYIIYGAYSEVHTFPYIITSIFTGHSYKEFGKLFLIESDGVCWNWSHKITNSGRFSVSNPSICFDDKNNILYIVWEDERLGYWNKTIFFDYFYSGKFFGNIMISGDIREAVNPLITCDNKGHLYIVWIKPNKNDMGDLYFRERNENLWQEIVKIDKGNFINSIDTDTLGNVHIIWGDGCYIYYKIKHKSFWSKTNRFIGKYAKIIIDKTNLVHLALLREKKQNKYDITYSIWKYNIS